MNKEEILAKLEDAKSRLEAEENWDWSVSGEDTLKNQQYEEGRFYAHQDRLTKLQEEVAKYEEQLAQIIG